MSSRKGKRLEIEIFAGSGLRYTDPQMALIFSNVVLFCSVSQPFLVPL